jgi:hypothetical protein
MGVSILPRRYLDEDDIEDDLVRLCDGATLVLVDSLRAAFPHADENSSEIRGHLDVLSRVSERTGAGFAVIHHARKPQRDSPGGATHSIRGSSALFDACQTVFVFEGEKDVPTRVHHQKDRLRGLTLPEFGLTSEDVPGESGPRHGLALRHLEAEELNAEDESKSEASAERRLENGVARIEAYFERHGGTVLLSAKAIRSQLQIKSSTFEAAWAELQRTGRLKRVGTGMQCGWTLSYPSPL